MPGLAQQRIGTSADQGRGQRLIREAFPKGQRPLSETPEKIEPFDPKPTGIITAIAEEGPIMLSPLAPASYGDGRQFLTRYWEQAKFSQESGANTNPPYGGLVFFGWDF